MPRIETNSCDRNTGAGCVNPPITDDGDTAAFYPIFTTGKYGTHCVWQEGGAHVPGTTNTFGGTSTAEYGSLLVLNYLTFGGGGTTLTRYNNFRHVLDKNPCAAW